MKTQLFLKLLLLNIFLFGTFSSYSQNTDTTETEKDKTVFFYDDEPETSTNEDDVKYITEELNAAFEGFINNLPVVTTYIDDSGMKVYSLSNVGSKDIEIMKKCNNSIYFENEEIVIPTIKFVDGENTTDILIIKQRCGSEVEVEKIEIPNIPIPVIEVVDIENGGKRVIIADDNEIIETIDFDKNEQINNEHIETIFDKKEQSSMDDLENEMDNLNSDKTEKNNEEINSSESSTGVTVVESSALQLKKLQEKNIPTELDNDVQNLEISKFEVSNDFDESKISIKINTESDDIIKIKIFDIDGNLIIEDNITNSKEGFVKNIEQELIEGVYFIQVIQNDKIETRHFIISK